MEVLFKYFKKFNIFSKLNLNHYSYHQKEQFYKRLKLVKYKKGDIVFDYGDEADYFYLIVNGRVSVQVPTVVKK
jgi:CRP-like cAMP-binding protein